MEKWDLYDKDRIKLGKTTPRGVPFAAGEYHLVVHLCILNQDGRMLIQHRQPFKDGWPDKWDLTAGGSALAGESSQQAAERELFEEIGFQADLSTTRPIFTLNFPRGFDDFYVLKAEVDLSTLSLQASEVQAVRWASREEVMRMIDSEEFIPYHPGLIGLIFEMEDRHGAQGKTKT